MESDPYEYSNGDVAWFLSDGSYHRLDGPAIILVDGTQYWYKYDELHRLDGPAIIWKDGRKSWFINDYNVTNKINQWAKEMNIDLDNLSDEDKFMIRLYWENYDEE